MNALDEVFAAQAKSCGALGSPFMDQLLTLCAQRWPHEGALAETTRTWPGDIGPMAASIPLRIAGGLHALVLTKRAPDLAAVYPPAQVSDDALWEAVSSALDTHEAFLLDWIENPPQTNEVRRAAALIPAAALLTARFGLPLQLSELGASAGLNLNFDRFRLIANDVVFGPESDVQLAPNWHGPVPTPTPLQVEERRGVDLAPVDLAAPNDRLRLIAYLWPDQSERLRRTEAAMALTPAVLDKADAVEWLGTRLAPAPGRCHMLYSTIAWQYLPAEAQMRGAKLIEAAGHAATETAPLAWVKMEPDRSDPDQAPGAALTLHLWPGGTDIVLGRIDFHGRWVRWTGPTHLT